MDTHTALDEDGAFALLNELLVGTTFAITRKTAGFKKIAGRVTYVTGTRTDTYTVRAGQIVLGLDHAVIPAWHHGFATSVRITSNSNITVH
jgi:hypothetical protein